MSKSEKNKSSHVPLVASMVVSHYTAWGQREELQV